MILLAYIYKNIIQVKTQYKTNNINILAIIKAFKTWLYHLDNYEHKIFIFTN